MEIELPTLYAHQEELKNNTRSALARDRSVIMCVPPGTGKTRIAKWILGKSMAAPRSANRSGRVLFTVHRRGLVDNASTSFSESPELPHGIVMSGKEASWGMDAQVASIDTLLSWFCDNGIYKGEYTYDLIIFDEAHSHATKLRGFLNAHNLKREELGLCEPFVLGLSATPQGKDLSDVFNSIVMGPSTAWLTEQGFLKPYRYFRATEGKLAKLIKKGDEFTSDSVAEAMDGLAGDLVRDWKKYAEGRSTIGFFPRRQHAFQAMELLTAAGVRAEYVDGTTPDDERKSMFKRLNSGQIDYICNVGIVERGTDIPRVGCVQLCTAIGSIARYFQMIGRGSRPHPDVADCLTLDHGGNVKRHGFFDDVVNWTLDWKSRPAKCHKSKPSVSCPVCDAIYRGGRCKHCGYEPKRKELAAQGLDFDGRELVEVSPKDRKAKKTKTPEQYMISALYSAGKSRKTFAQAIGIAKSMAAKDGTDFVVPKRFTVAGKTYKAIDYGDRDSKRPVSETYAFTTGNYSERDNPYCLGPAQSAATVDHEGFLFDV